MSPTLFQFLIILAGIAATASMVAEGYGARSLSDILRAEKERQSALTIAFCKANPVFTLIRMGIIFGYLIALGYLGAFMPASREVFLVFSVAWSVLSYVDAPHILPKTMVPFYEMALMVNGAVLALAFWSPVAQHFSL